MLHAGKQTEARDPSPTNGRVGTSTKHAVREDWEDDDDDDDEEESDPHEPAVNSAAKVRIPPTPSRLKYVPEDWDGGDDRGFIEEPGPQSIPSEEPVSSVIFQVSGHAPSFPPQPAVRILKRPSPSSTSPALQPAPSASVETLQAREARYRAARERIFNEVDGAAVSSVIREPRGPSSGPNASAGFTGRKNVSKRDTQPSKGDSDA